ncbi:MAG: hypothetical protein K8E24_005580 [Methanobacterium paludis]|nr:hypothetical protein [Methanobacterium paludis]
MKEDKLPTLDTDEIKQDLKLSKGDATAAVTKAAINLVPILGGPVTELFDAVTTPMLSKRRDKWMVMFAEAINELAGRMDESSFENLPKNEMFITTVMHASQIAIRNHQEEKLTALKNAIISSALENAPEEDLQLIFFDLINSCTTLHLKLLKFINEPKSKEFVDELTKNIKEVKNENVDGVFYLIFDLGEVLEYKYPELKGKNHIYEHILRDLQSKELMIYYEFKIEPDGRMDSLMMPMGEMLLSFITSPEI